MADFFDESVFLGIFLSLMCYEVGSQCQKRWKSALLNPLLIAILLTIAILVLCGIPYDTYYAGGRYISYLLTPATICLAIPLYEQFESLKKNVTSILMGIASGVLASLLSVLALAHVLKLDHREYITFLPKSITTAIGMGVSEQLGGYAAITAAVIIITGVVGNMIAEPVCRKFGITHPIAKGIGIGTSSHATGTAKAMEIGEVEGAMSGLSIAVAGLMTVLAALVFAGFY